MIVKAKNFQFYILSSFHIETVLNKCKEKLPESYPLYR